MKPKMSLPAVILQNPKIPHNLGAAISACSCVEEQMTSGRKQIAEVLGLRKQIADLLGTFNAEPLLERVWEFVMEQKELSYDNGIQQGIKIAASETKLEALKDK
jgi:hypothetical protein